MLLHSPLYLLFLLIVFAIYWLMPNFRWQKYILIIASYLFYAWIDLRFLALLMLLTLFGYLIGCAILKSRNTKRYLIISVLTNLGFLFVFKYANFFIGSVIHVFSRANLILPAGLSLLLPVGISFYTFQSISYSVELYRKKIEPADNLLDYAIYLAFFPKLLAGPLVRPANFLNQLGQPKNQLDKATVMAALELLVMGLVKKVLIADNLAIMSGAAFRAADLPIQANLFPTPLYIQGFYLYAFQIYADFSGYTDIAIASAALLGFILPENFQQPYLSSTVTIFWNRWHMSLTQWFREYIYFPISRGLLIKSKRRYPRLIQSVDNFVTMVLIGLWHGAALTFIAWGGWHALLLSSESVLKIKPTARWQKIVYGIITFHMVGVGWILFRSSSLAAAGRFFRGLLSFNQMYWLPHYLPSIFLTAFLVFGLDVIVIFKGKIPANVREAWRTVLVIASLVVLVSLGLLSAARGANTQPFIYGLF